MSYDELELDRMGDRRTATFFCISDTDSTYNFLVALAFSQMFNLLCERADNVHGGRLPHHVRVLWDEAANTGQVPQLEKLVAVIRSREISLCLLYTSDLDVKLQAGDEISGCYLSGTINGSSVRVVDVTIKGNASQGINDLISLNEVSDYITEKGYTSKDFEESLMGRFREDIIRSWGASDLLFSGINADGWYLDDDKNRGISLTYDGDGYVCEVVIWSGEKETGVDR